MIRITVYQHGPKEDQITMDTYHVQSYMLDEGFLLLSGDSQIYAINTSEVLSFLATSLGEDLEKICEECAKDENPPTLCLLPKNYCKREKEK